MKKRSCLALLMAICLCAIPLAACKAPASGSLPPDVSEETLPLPPEESVEPPVAEVTPETPTEPPVVEVTPPVVEKPAPPQTEYIQCTGESVNLRSGAGTKFSVLGSAKKGTMYAVTGKVGSWYKTYYRGKTAYVSASYVSVFSLEKTESAVEKVLDEGYKLIGVPYVYGAVRVHDGKGKLLSGFNVQKFDCSSLVQYIFYKGAGTLLGLHTRAQVKQGKFVKKADLRRGDCIFFTNEERKNNVGLERVGHVAVYLGDGYILHTASDYARIEKISAKRWSFYLEARRFL